MKKQVNFIYHLDERKNERKKSENFSLFILCGWMKSEGKK